MDCRVFKGFNIRILQHVLKVKPWAGQTVGSDSEPTWELESLKMLEGLLMFLDSTWLSCQETVDGKTCVA